MAGRFRRAVQEEGARQRREAERAREAQERAERERQRLFDDLIAFAEETGFLRARLREGALALIDGERELRFVPVGAGDAVEVDFEGRDPEERHRLYLEPRLGDAWVWGRTRPRRPREDRLLFWDAGLEELLVVGLGLPRPEDGPPEEGEEGEGDAPGGSTRRL